MMMKMMMGYTLAKASTTMSPLPRPPENKNFNDTVVRTIKGTLTYSE
jgi:hypothetical protein